MKREELGQLLCDQVLAGVNDGHLRSDGIHVLSQGNLVLLRLVPIGVKPCGKRMNLICEGLSRTGGDLRVAVHEVARTRCGCWDIIVDLIIRLVWDPELRPWQLLLEVQHGDPGQLA